MKRVEGEDWLCAGNLGYLEELYQQYVVCPEAVDEKWRRFFSEDLPRISDQTIKSSDHVGLNGNVGRAPNGAIPTRFNGDSLNGSTLQGGDVLTGDARNALIASVKIRDMLEAYRARGYLKADLDPINPRGQSAMGGVEGLTLADYGLSGDATVSLNGTLGFKGEASAEAVLELLESTYCGSIGYEFMHIERPELRNWIIERVEGYNWRSELMDDEQRRLIYRELMEAEMFENFLHVRYPGAKRFSIEGAEATMVALAQTIERKSALGVQEVLIGMPHRGRLNVLTKIMGKSYEGVFAEFRGNVEGPTLPGVSGDVKYHMGRSIDRKLRSGDSVHISLLSNPSHLEAVDPVLLGKIYARRRFEYGGQSAKLAGIMMHGDAAFSAQGVVYESLVTGALPHYDAGGIIHIIVNNRIGFTTDPDCGRTMQNPSFVARSLDVPVFHVNGDDPEAVAFVSVLAADFSSQFGSDVVIDIVCYRRYGHNESDEPRFTQPIMYKKIGDHPTPSNVYVSNLLNSNGSALKQEFFDSCKDEFGGLLEQEFQKSANFAGNQPDWFKGRWEGFNSSLAMTAKAKALEKLDDEWWQEGTEYLQQIAAKVNACPEGFNMHPKIAKLFKSRLEAVESGKGIDWANAESLAFASIVLGGMHVRLSGQDCCRGTFSQRHAVVVDQEDGKRYTTIHALDNGDALFEVINSPLSEYAVLGFEYGYSLVEPRSLVIWEAQFGDFANGAQIIIDQFIASAEVKWLRSSGLVMLLPHGYEGQGPEHSSARVERFLQLCANDNMRVVNCTTPANYFHVLRRQVSGCFRKPLIVFTPKSLLRHPMALSDLKDFAGGFVPVMFDRDKLKKKCRKVVFCAGKVCYDLLAACPADVLLIRLEQFYPFPGEEILDCLQAMLKVKAPSSVVWCQEEPQNMGGWGFVRSLIDEVLEKSKIKFRITYAGREASAATAVGSAKVHAAQQKALVEKALA